MRQKVINVYLAILEMYCTHNIGEVLVNQAKNTFLFDICLERLRIT